MALIKCIECGNSISSFAQSCPHCGCPANIQTADYIDVSNGLRNGQKWENILDLVKKKEIIQAINEIKEILNIRSLAAAHEIYVLIRDTGNLPVDLIREKYPDQFIQPTTKPCSACGRTISVKAESCPHCGEPTGVHVCPKCGSTDVVYIDAVSKVASMALFGAFSVNTVRNKYECTKCKMKF